MAVFKKYKNRGIDMDGLSMSDPSRYRKINAVLRGRDEKLDLLDVAETVPLEYEYSLADTGPSPEDILNDSEMKYAVSKALNKLTAREERVIRMRFGIGMTTDFMLEEVGKQFSVGRERIRQIEAKALRKLKNPAFAKNLRSFLDVA